MAQTKKKTASKKKPVKTGKKASPGKKKSLSAEKIRAERMERRARILRHRKRLRRSLRHELANQVSHGVGVGMGIAGLAFLVVKGALMSDALRVTAYAIYGTANIILYLASTLYHSIPSPKVKKLFRRMDHASIYIAIAGAYTPITLITLGAKTGWILFSIVWVMAIAGVLYKIIFPTAYEFISVSLYILMGWLIIFAIKPLMMSIPSPGLWLLLSGGISYTAGVIFFFMERMPYHHMIWHLFVLGGGVTHFLAIYIYV